MSGVLNYINNNIYFTNTQQVCEQQTHVVAKMPAGFGVM
jgi:hypothetical protein